MPDTLVTRDTPEPDLDMSRLSHLVGYAATRASIQMRKTFVKHLGAALGLSAQNLAVLLNRLAEGELIEHVRSTVDRRAQQIHPTPAGSEQTARAEAIAATMETDALRRVSDTERALLVEVLLKVAGGHTTRR